MSRAERLSAGIGLAGLLASLLGWHLAGPTFYGAWLAAFCLLAGLPLGSLTLLLAHALTGGGWGWRLRPALCAGVATMPLLLPAALPLLFGLDRLYPWLSAGPDLPNRFYLNGPFFGLRALLYAVVWLGLAAAVLRAERQGRPLIRLAPPGLMLLALTVTFATIDLALSPDPAFNSTVWGLLSAAGMTLFALAAAIAALRPAAPEAAPAARLLLGLTILWAYLEGMQALIVWESDLPHEAAWYLPRIGGGWGLLAWGLVAGHFAVPFAALLPGRGRWAGAVALLLLAMAPLHWWWLLLPSLGEGLSWIDAAALAALGGLMAAVYLHGCRRHLRTGGTHA